MLSRFDLWLNVSYSPTDSPDELNKEQDADLCSLLNAASGLRQSGFVSDLISAENDWLVEPGRDKESDVTDSQLNSLEFWPIEILSTGMSFEEGKQSEMFVWVSFKPSKDVWVSGVELINLSFDWHEVVSGWLEYSSAPDESNFNKSDFEASDVTNEEKKSLLFLREAVTGLNAVLTTNLSFLAWVELSEVFVCPYLNLFQLKAEPGDAFVLSNEEHWS